MTTDNDSIGTRKSLTLRSSLLMLFVLALMAVSTRILPLTISPLPYNQDGLTECRIASDIIQTGHLTFPDGTYYAETHSVATPVYDVLLAFVSSAIGVPAIDIAQIVVGAIAIVTVVCGFLIAKQIVGRTREALAGALVLGLLGTFLFLTGSTWKESLGVAMLLLLYYSYMNRSDLRLFALEVVILGTIPFIHHLVAALGYLSIGFLTIWSIAFAVRNHSFTRRHLLDVSVLALLSSASYVYYAFVKLDRLSYVRIEGPLVFMIMVFLGLSAIMFLWLIQKKHLKYSFAPVPAVLIFSLFVMDYFYPLFPYDSGSPSVILIFAGAMCVLVGVAWLGVEDIVESKNIYRAIPLGVLLPVIAVIAISLTSGFTLSAHQTLYRSFDFADIGIALGISLGVMHFRKRPRAQALVIAIVVTTLIVTMPFSYATGKLTGVRHDTQLYETDALQWLKDSAGSDWMLQSDERLSYVATALYDFERMPYLPSRFSEEGLLGTGAFYVIEEEWMTVGVNDYPRGHPIVNETRVQFFLTCSNIFYIGGPVSNELTIFSPSGAGYDTFGLS